MEIRTQRLLLRPIGTKDLLTTYEYAADRENTKLMTFLPDDNIEQTEEFLEECEQEWNKKQPCFYEFAVIADGKHIGGVGLYLKGINDTAEMGWILNRSYQGKGYATEAADAVMGFAKDQLAVKHFIAHCDSENRASQNVMSKLGFYCMFCCGGRKNKSSNENRKEMTFEKFI